MFNNQIWEGGPRLGNTSKFSIKNCSFQLFQVLLTSVKVFSKFKPDSSPCLASKIQTPVSVYRCKFWKATQGWMDTGYWTVESTFIWVCNIFQPLPSLIWAAPNDLPWLRAAHISLFLVLVPLVQWEDKEPTVCYITPIWESCPPAVAQPLNRHEGFGDFPCLGGLDW